jgi:hypothetical protein
VKAFGQFTKAGTATCIQRHSHSRSPVPSRPQRQPCGFADPDGSDRNVIVTGCRLPDGVAVDAAAGRVYWTNIVYWTNMGSPKANDGSTERADLDGRNRKTIVPRSWRRTVHRSRDGWSREAKGPARRIVMNRRLDGS